MQTGQARAQRIAQGQAVASTFMAEVTGGKGRFFRETPCHVPCLDAWLAARGERLRPEDETGAMLGALVLRMCPSRATAAAAGKVRGEERRLRENAAHNAALRRAYQAAIRNGEVQVTVERAGLNMNRVADRALVRLTLKRERRRAQRLAAAP